MAIEGILLDAPLVKRPKCCSGCPFTHYSDFQRTLVCNLTRRKTEECSPEYSLKRGWSCYWVQYKDDGKL